MGVPRISGGRKLAASMPPRWTPSERPMSAATARFVKSFVRLRRWRIALSVWPLKHLRPEILLHLTRSARRLGRRSERRARFASLLNNEPRD